MLIGTSGWMYQDWRHRFYDGVPQKSWFEHVTTYFRTVELNVSFYRLPSRETFAGWHRRSPDDEIVTVKASRYLTHVKRLREPVEPVERLMSRASALEWKLGPVLIQLPPDLEVDVGALSGDAGRVPRWSPAGRRAAPRVMVAGRGVRAALGPRRGAGVG